MLDISPRNVSFNSTTKGAASDRQKLIAEIKATFALCQTLQNSMEINGAEPWALTFQVLNQDDTGPTA